jgi:translocation and assembly module TamA
MSDRGGKAMSRTGIATRLALVIGLVIAAAEGHADEPVLRYRVRIEGVADAALRNLLQQVSRLVARTDQNPPSFRALERRAEGDEEDLKKVLDSEGYYDGTVDVRFDSEKEPLEAVIVVDPGMRFTIAAFDIRFTDERDGPPPALLAQKNVLPPAGSPARAADILAAQYRMLDTLHQAGYPLAKVSQESYEVDRTKDSMMVHWTVDHGGPWRFGPLSVEGAPDVDHGFIARKVPWRPGDRFNMALFAKYRAALDETGLFNGITLTPDASHAGPDDTLPVTLGLKERPPRSIALGATYSTNEGPGLQISWQHRNLFHRGRQLSLSLAVATIRQSLEASYRSPEFKRADQSLVLGVALRGEDNDAYQEKSATASVGIEREFTKALHVSAAVAPEYSIIDDNTGRHTTELLNFPLIANYDTSDDFLDPTRGVRGRLTVTPSVGNRTGPLSFLTVEATAATYLRLAEKPRLILGLRTRLGVILGENTDDIPANHRFYAGGGGSVRGYGYKKIGPLDASNNPQGGRTVNEFGAELRIRITDTIGLVPFVEAGNVYNGSFDSFGTDLRLGAGLGLRYYTAIGPLRLDIGVPLDRRPGVDDAVQIYVSIGQAF